MPAAHQIELAVRDGDASWCSCTCGWASPKAAHDDCASAWAAHVAEASLTGTTTFSAEL